MDLGEFLQLVWRAGDDKRMVIDYVKKRRDQLRK
jgi:hypothetical protein